MLYNRAMRPLHGTALLGGAFDPPHAAHIQMAERALALGCERVVFVPSANPPHKRCTADFFDRVAMLEAAIAGRADMSVDTIEGGDGAVHYSYLMLPRLVDKYGDCVFVIGGDSLARRQVRRLRLCHRRRQPDRSGQVARAGQGRRRGASACFSSQGQGRELRRRARILARQRG